MKYLVIVLLPLAIFSCQSITSKHEANISIVKDYVKTVENMDYTAMTELLHDDYMGYGPSETDSIDKQLALLNWRAHGEHLYESIKYIRSQYAGIMVEEGPNQGNWVANWAKLQIKFKNEASDVTIWANSNYKVEDGKIIKSITFYNEADVMNQLGYAFIHPEFFN